MNVSKSINSLLILITIFTAFGCANVFESLQLSANKISGAKSISNAMGQFKVESKENNPAAQIFIDVHDLGRRITLHSSFNEFFGTYS